MGGTTTASTSITLPPAGLILLTLIGTGKTSTYSISLNWDNPIVEKTLALALTEDALRNQRWMSNFAELENKADFIMIYGSIIHSPKEAKEEKEKVLDFALVRQ